MTVPERLTADAATGSGSLDAPLRSYLLRQLNTSIPASADQDLARSLQRVRSCLRSGKVARLQLAVDLRGIHDCGNARRQAA